MTATEGRVPPNGTTRPSADTIRARSGRSILAQPARGTDDADQDDAGNGSDQADR